jgi:general L-amino acid transport system substrate-binding protein
MRRGLIVVAVAVLTLVAGSGSAQAGATFDAVKARGFVQCGTNVGLAGFSSPDSRGRWTGLDVDICRAVAAALFGDAEKVKYTPLSTQQRFTALQSGEIDLLSRNTSWTLTRDTSNGLHFAPVTFYDGQGFMVAKKLGVKSARELDGATICVQTGTTTELNLADYFRSHNMTFQPVVIEALSEVNHAFFSGRCDVLTSDTSQLASIRAADAPNPEDYVILPELISKEPLAPAVRHGDDQWFDLVRWVVFATLEAEEKGISSQTVDAARASTDPAVQRLLGVQPGMGQALGIDDKWVYNIVKQVGNYAEIFQRNVGKDSPLKLERGLNALWTQGGLMYSPPIR